MRRAHQRSQNMQAALRIGALRLPSTLCHTIPTPATRMLACLARKTSQKNFCIAP